MSCCKGETIWTFKDPDIDVSLLEPVFEQFAGTRGTLITILQKAQDLYNYLPIDLVAYIAHRTGLKPAQVLGVVTFYTQFRTQPVGKHLIMLCQGTACHVNGSAAIETAVLKEIGVAEGEITPDGLFTLNNVACLGCCSLSPVMMIGENTYGNLTPASAKKVIADIRSKEGDK